ncbi:MerC family mercury resistance protein [Arhodomonas sp. AD133]|uniref:MerC family mercury resistance protein n=1 Tax=Arhodomonas sp. AD133 TaxID=3415009 RepID=UPI003EB8E067
MSALRVFSGRSLARLWLRGAIGAAAMGLAVLSCYGVLALTLLLPLVGARLVLDDAVWSGAITLFTVLTVLAVLPGYRMHRGMLPGVGALAGGGLILYALLVDYRLEVELAGFLLLAAAVLHDGRLRRKTPNRLTDPG